MLKRIVWLSLRYRVIVIVAACLLAAYGIFVMRGVKLDVFPEFAPPRIVIQTEAAGLSAEEVETLVTRRIEYALNGTPDLEALYSQSIQGLSVVTAMFREGADIYRARQMTGEKLSEIGSQLPLGVGRPEMGPLTSSTSLTLAIGLVSPELSPMDLRTFADWTVRFALLSVPGVARVETFGGEIRQIQVQVKPDRLLAYGMSVEDVLAAARDATGVRGAGFIENENQRIVVRPMGQALAPEELGEAVAGYHDGMSVRLKDVAEVTLGAEPKLGDGQVMGRPGIILLVHSQFGANTLEVTEAVEGRLDEMKPVFAEQNVAVYPGLFRPANFIETSIDNIGRSLAIGGALVVVVLFFFLADLRSAFITFITIPLSLLAAVIVLAAFGASLNTITLGGFAISIGVVVDDAIIGLENVVRRLRENRRRSDPGPDKRVVLDATLEVRSPIVYATFIVAAVFWPVLAMSGVNGRLFAPLAVAFILATLASLVVAVSLTPALSSLMLARTKSAEPAYNTWLKRQHGRWLRTLLRRPKAVIGASLAVCVAAGLAVPFFGGEFLPEFKEGHYIMRLMTAPGSSLPASLRTGTAITAELLKNPNIKSVSQQIGRAEQGEDTMGPEFSEFHIELHPMSGRRMERAKEDIRTTLDKFPGITLALTPFLEERIEEILSGGRGEVVINLFGNDLETIDQKAREVRDLVVAVPGARDVLIATESGSPEITVSLRKDRLRQFGFETVDVLDAVQTAYQGTVVAQTYDNDRIFDVTVILHPDSRRAPEAIGALIIRSADGLRLPLRELATIRLASGRSIIFHEGTRRRQQVTCNVEGRDLASFVDDLKQTLASRVAFPAGMSIVYGGAAEAAGKARNELLFNSLIAGAVIMLLLFIVFNGLRHMLLVLANLPFALAGGVLAAFLTGGSLSIGSLVGFVSLFGISMRNSILLISHYEHLVADEGMTWGPETAVRGASERLLPILMTALVVTLGLLPIAWGAGEAGKEIEGPMAIVILGGLLTSTVLNLLVLPVLASRFGRFQKAKAEF